MGRPEETGVSPYEHEEKTKKEKEEDLLYGQYYGKFCKFQLHAPASFNIYELEYMDRANGMILKIKLSDEDRKWLIKLLRKK